MRGNLPKANITDIQATALTCGAPRRCTNHWRDLEERSMLDRLPSLVNPWSQGKAGCISISQSFCPPSLSGSTSPAAWSSQWVHLNQCLSPSKGQGNIQGPTVRTERGRYREWDPASQPEQTLWEARLDAASGASGQISPARGSRRPWCPPPHSCGDQLSCQGHPTRARVWPGRENTERGHSGVVLCKNS